MLYSSILKWKILNILKKQFENIRLVLHLCIKKKQLYFWQLYCSQKLPGFLFNQTAIRARNCIGHCLFFATFNMGHTHTRTGTIEGLAE